MESFRRRLKLSTVRRETIPSPVEAMESSPPTAPVPPASNPESITDNAPSTAVEPEQYLSPRPLMVMIASLFLIAIMITLDLSILATAIPRITDHFHTIADIGWYAAAYMLTNSALQPLTGKAYTYFSLKYTFLFFVALFELGSLICAVAQSSTMLVVGRAVAGMGGSGLLNGATIILGVAAPPDQRPMLMGLLMSMAGVGQLAGPLIGGALTQHASWRWCFWINLPVGGVTLLVMLFIKFPPYKARKASWTIRDVIHDFDIIGFSIFAPACVMLLLALEWGGSTYSWSSAIILGLLCGCAGAFVAFSIWEYYHGDAAMIPASLVGNRVVYSSMITTFFQFGSLIIFSYYMPLWFQVSKSASPTMSGVYTLPTFGAQITTVIIAGALVTRLGYPVPFAVVGSALATVSAGLMSTLDIHAGAGKWVGYQIINGVGRGLSIQQPIQAVQAVVKPDMIATATSNVMWAQTFGGAICIGLAQTAFLNLLRSALKTRAPGVDASNLIAAGATDFLGKIARSGNQELLRGVLLAYHQAIAHTFYLAAGCAVASVVSCLGIGKTKLESNKNKKNAPQAEDEEKGLPDTTGNIHKPAKSDEKEKAPTLDGSVDSRSSKEPAN
ncbi:hypothetical protein HRR83_001815 [Exophiala dermatitidis]|uniref:Major facilitator superfamily (MFS) profile domain-containing protein n=1 Tax=Exophiala dermatitidis TaxID=5970 RepID=A0AAN6IXQ9_EXODE|nr:hypothetical protein HRR73_004946 [Exophiala dermatitidis]KAJ4523273.1 hypothetical protein HRR75_001674 [Exophiala dermatitidis]KAJ4526618.1 hypothetical protein HRR74_001818 [Exophiala dermatitidis]KAJ4532134.1 hypothetical protein HRR76_007133 [Exophiala dermatitidis]KAJ4546169.1 hypothetical protein HRR77_004706 [Exophiala dermatitidis]